jgi:hypothetical protein
MTATTSGATVNVQGSRSAQAAGQGQQGRGRGSSTGAAAEYSSSRINSRGMVGLVLSWFMHV